jgi:hypothetical protein
MAPAAVQRIAGSLCTERTQTLLAGWHDDTSNLLSGIDSAEHFAPFFSGSRSGAGSYDETSDEICLRFSELARQM